MPFIGKVYFPIFKDKTCVFKTGSVILNDFRSAAGDLIRYERLDSVRLKLA